MATNKTTGADGLTVNDRAEKLANAINASKPRLAQMLLVDAAYFNTCSGLRLSNRMITCLQTIFPSLDVKWFMSGEGKFNASEIEIPTEHLRLIGSKSSIFKKLMSDPNGEDAAVQYIQDCGVDPISFSNKYRHIYPALIKYGKSKPSEPINVFHEEPSRTAHDTVADLLALTREQQKTIASMNDQIRDLQNVIINYIKWQNQPK